MSSSSRRDQILNAALNLFVRDGSDATGVRAIASEAGIRQASIYYYFASKDEILDALIDRVSAGHMRIRDVPDDADLATALTLIGRRFLETMAIPASRDLVHLTLFETAHQQGRAERYLSEINDRAVSLVEEVVAPRLPADSAVGARTVAKSFSAALVSHVLHDEMLAAVAGRPLEDGVAPDRMRYLDELVSLTVNGTGGQGPTEAGR